MKKQITRQRNSAPSAKSQAPKTNYHLGDPGDPHIWILLCGVFIEAALQHLNHHLGVPIASGIGGFAVAYWKFAGLHRITTPTAALLSSQFGLNLALSLYIIMNT